MDYDAKALALALTHQAILTAHLSVAPTNVVTGQWAEDEINCGNKYQNIVKFGSGADTLPL